MTLSTEGQAQKQRLIDHHKGKQGAPVHAERYRVLVPHHVACHLVNGGDGVSAGVRAWLGKHEDLAVQSEGTVQNVRL